MSCNCKNKEQRLDLKYVIEKAYILSKVIHSKVCVYQEGIYKSKPLYNFEPYNKERLNIIKII